MATFTRPQLRWMTTNLALPAMLRWKLEDALASSSLHVELNSVERQIIRDSLRPSIDNEFRIVLPSVEVDPVRPSALRVSTRK
jgi:hypothetical protein